MNVEIVPMQPADWPLVREIYAEGIATGDATFETDVPDWEQWDRAHLRDCRLVANENGKVIGWAALSPVSARRVYAGVAEISIYVAEAVRGRKVGKSLLESLIRESEMNGIWTLQAGIFPENTASVALHTGCRFTKVGVRQRIGKLRDRWRDVLLLERRSSKTGV